VSIQSAPYYWVICDSCGRNAQEDTDYAAWAHQETALDVAVDGGWSASEQLGKHHCPRCERFCEKCGELAGDTSGERDWLCKTCWEFASADEEGSGDA
jgi:hypothetical protein